MRMANQMRPLVWIKSALLRGNNNKETIPAVSGCVIAARMDIVPSEVRLARLVRLPCDEMPSKAQGPHVLHGTYCTSNDVDLGRNALLEIPPRRNTKVPQNSNFTVFRRKAPVFATRRRVHKASAQRFLLLRTVVCFCAVRPS